MCGDDPWKSEFHRTALEGTLEGRRHGVTLFMRRARIVADGVLERRAHHIRWQLERREGVVVVVLVWIHGSGGRASLRSASSEVHRRPRIVPLKTCDIREIGRAS